MKKKIKAVFLLGIVMVLLMPGCAYFSPAPLKDGMQLSYKVKGMKETCDIAFKEIKSGRFEVTVSVSDDYVSSAYFIKPSEKDQKIIVNRFMKRRNGKPLEFERFGPLWLPPSERKKGKNAGMDMILGVTTGDRDGNWEDWRVYIVDAAAFHGAISGSWYYEEKTGFLIACRIKTVMSEILSNDKSPDLLLAGSNVEGLVK